MKIRKKDAYYGMALHQVLLHPKTESMEPVKLGRRISRDAFLVNGNIGVYLMWARKPKGEHDEYAFRFTYETLDKLKELSDKTKHVYVAMICFEGRDICCFPYPRFAELIQRRKQEYGGIESTYMIYATLEAHQRFHLYANALDAQEKPSRAKYKVPRNGFPRNLFKAASRMRKSK